MSVAQTVKCCCGQGKPGTTTRNVKLQEPPKTPSFYYRAEDSVVFISPDEVEKLLSRWAVDRDSAKRLASRVHSDLPLKDDQDLLRYDFADWINWRIIEGVVMDALESGDVAIVELGGVWEKRISVVHEHGAGSCRTVVYRGEKGVNRIHTTLDCSD